MKKYFLIYITIISLILCACSPEEKVQVNNGIVDTFDEEALYSKALEEDVLVVYTVTTRITKVKEAFEKEYPGLFVEIRDLRSPDLVENVRKSYENGTCDCDVVICNSNSGDFRQGLVDTGILYSYIPDDINDDIYDECKEEVLNFMSEAEMLFYNGEKYDTCPISNIWELIDEKYRGGIYIPSPLRSFSTFAFCGSVLSMENEMKDSYMRLFGTELPQEISYAEYFFEKLSENVVYTNSSDEVCEAFGPGLLTADFGIMVSSKVRQRELGYSMVPITNLDPFSGTKSNFASMMVNGCANENSAKLFIHFLFGGKDGKGEGFKPFNTEGTWSTRKSVPDGNSVPLNEMSIIVPDEDYLNSNRDYIENFFTEINKN